MTATQVPAVPALRRFLYASPLYGLTLRGPVPGDLRPTETPWTGSTAIGARILQGAYAIDGREIPLDSAWPRMADGDDAALAHGFCWLADLRAIGSPNARARALSLIAGWIERHDSWDPLAWRLDILGERLSNWLVSGSFLTGGEDQAAAAGRLRRSAARQARHLRRCLRDLPANHRAFRALEGLIVAGVCLPGAEAGLAEGLKLLEREIRRQVLPDGGILERSPSLLLELLRRFIGLRAVLLAGQQEVPPWLQNAIDRMVPLLRALRLGDGRLALFNGGTESVSGVIDATLAQAHVRAKALDSAPHAGFQRLTAGKTLVIADTGAPPPAGADGAAHAGTLAFEMSVGRERLVVNCGNPGPANPPLAQALRATAAHSTLAVDDTNSSEILADGRLGRRPAAVQAERHEEDGKTWLSLSHDGYLRPFGLVHRRTLYLGAEGGDLRGEELLDSERGAGRGRTFALRFHLAPRVTASVVQDGSSVLLRPPTGAGWRFTADGGRIALEDSVYAGDPSQIRRCEQIVVSGFVDLSGRTKVRWALRREDAGR
ncbi:MAG: heparinase II/III family protein [Hyphomicrobiales bacterium]|nr:heparinase II/III family protein [Hyphomicrobiales bacterium]